MSKIDIALFILSNIGSFLIGGYHYFKDGFKLGYMKATKDQSMLFVAAIKRAFSPNEEEIIHKVANEFENLANQIEQRSQEIKNAGR